MDDAYVHGFMQKCAELGFDPELLVKQSLDEDVGKTLGTVGGAAAGGYGAAKGIPKLMDMTAGRIAGTTAKNPVKSVENFFSLLDNPAKIKRLLQLQKLRKPAMIGGGVLAGLLGALLGRKMMTPRKKPSLPDRAGDLMKQVKNYKI